MSETRFPLAVSTEPRDYILSKDSKLTNCFLEQDPLGIARIIKRAGTTLEDSTGTVNLGIFYYSGKVYFVNTANAGVLNSFNV